MNQVQLIGNVTKDIELRESAGGTKYVQFTIGVHSSRANATTNFIDIIAFSRQAEILSQYAYKGCKLCISGRLNNSQYIDHEGNKRNTLKVILENFEFADKNKKAATTQEVAVTSENN